VNTAAPFTPGGLLVQTSLWKLDPVTPAPADRTESLVEQNSKINAIVNPAAVIQMPENGANADTVAIVQLTKLPKQYSMTTGKDNPTIVWEIDLNTLGAALFFSENGVIDNKGLQVRIYGTRPGASS
jgi:hypothetical protein